MWSHLLEGETYDSRADGYLSARARTLKGQERLTMEAMSGRIFGDIQRTEDGFFETGFKCAVEGQVPSLYLNSIRAKFGDPAFLSGLYTYNRPETLVYSGASSMGGKEISSKFPLFAAYVFSKESGHPDSMMYQVDRAVEYTQDDGIHEAICPGSSDARKLCEILVRGVLPERVIGEPVFPEVLPFTDPGLPQERIQQSYKEAVSRLENADKKEMLRTALMGRGLPVPQQSVTELMSSVLTPQ